jgi:hypothetical protein
MMSMSSQEAQDLSTSETVPIKLDVAVTCLPPTNAPMSPGTFTSPTGPGGESQEEEFGSVPEFLPWQDESKAASAWWVAHLSDNRYSPAPNCASGRARRNRICLSSHRLGSSILVRRGRSLRVGLSSSLNRLRVICTGARTSQHSA